MNPTTHVQRQLAAALDEWAAAYARKDADAFAAAFGDHDDVVLLGTGGDEIAVGRAAIRDLLQRDFDEAGELDVKFGELRISTTADVAWVVAPDAVIEATLGGETQSIAVRITTVLQHTDGGWLIQHAHVSAPMANQDVGHSFPAPAPA
ncbi:MAG TPA: SgcJ/EcaC family oxidoreductase [Solirubrobacteraceae bacterium]|nr:SgcJ/EcaC family oxidoreductase [Solirubrobacteraceae bacterium]